MFVVAQTRGDPLLELATLRAAVGSLDPELPLFDATTIGLLLDEDASERRVASWLLGSFSSAALVLSVLGLYGLLSYLVRERTAEIGLRLALGARGEELMRSVLGDSARLVAMGVVLGGVLAFAGVPTPRIVPLWGVLDRSRHLRERDFDPRRRRSLRLGSSCVEGGPDRADGGSATGSLEPQNRLLDPRTSVGLPRPLVDADPSQRVRMALDAGPSWRDI